MDSLLVQDSLDKRPAGNMGNFIPSQLESWRELERAEQQRAYKRKIPGRANCSHCTAVRHFLSILSLLCQADFNGSAPMNESFFSIHGVPESINILKKPNYQNSHLFFAPSKFFLILCHTHMMLGIHYMPCYTPNQT